MHTDLYAAGAFFALATVALVLLMSLIKNDMEDGAYIRKVARKIYGAVVLLCLVALLVRGISISSTNRIPRSDVDRSDIYQQAQGNKNN
jgi:hypothetical protein